MEEYEALFEKLKTIQPHQPTYNFLDVIGKSDDENIISNWLAFLLDSERIGTEKPFEVFCEAIGVESERARSVRREYYLDNKRRIDIVIKTDHYWLVIENKINSKENNVQTRAYAERIREEIKNEDENANRDIAVRFLYLKPAYNISMPSEQDFDVLEYGKLLAHFKKLTEADFPQTTNYTYFSEFLKLIQERYVMVTELEFSEGTKLYIESKSVIRQIEADFAADCDRVLSKLKTALQEVFAEDEGWVIHQYLDYIEFAKLTWPREVHFEIGTWDWQRKQFGISFNRLISAQDVIVEFWIHDERKDTAKKNNRKIKTLHLDFSNNNACLGSIITIAKELQNIKTNYTHEVEGLLL